MKTIWFLHNAFKAIANSVIFVRFVMAIDVRYAFFAMSLYELVVDPMMLLATSRGVLASTVHHVFVTLWAFAIQRDSTRCVCASVALVALARAFLYAGVLNRSIRPLAEWVVASEFVGLLIEPLLGPKCVSPYVHPCQVSFVVLFLAYHAWIKVKEIGVILVFKTSDPRDPLLYPVFIPAWAKS